MTWLKVDDTFPSHRKVKRAGAEAIALWLAGCCYSSRHGTDGFLPSEDVPHLEWHAPGLPEQLVAVGLWEVAQGGYLIHDFLAYNPKADEVRAKKDAHAQQMRALRQRQKAGQVDVPVTTAARDNHVISTCASRDENVIDRSGLGDRARDHTVEFTVSGSDPVPEVQGTAPISNPDPPSVDDTTRARGAGYSTEKACLSTSHIQANAGPAAIVRPAPFALMAENAPRPHAKRSKAGGKALDHHPDAPAVLRAINEARGRLGIKGPGLGPTPGNLETISKRLASGETLEACLHVVAVCEAECRRDPDSLQWFNPVTPFRTENFARKVAQQVEQGRAGPKQQMRGLISAPKMIGEDRWLEDYQRMNAEDDEKCERDRQRLAAWRKDKDAAMAAGQPFDDDAWDDAWYAQHGGAP